MHNRRSLLPSAVPHTTLVEKKYRHTPRKPWILVSFSIFLLVNLIVYLYLRGYHRVSDVRALFNAVHKPVYDQRCRRHNETHYQCLPNVLLIGASKGGTTSIMSYLIKHQNITYVNRRIRPDKHKEVHRFDRDTYSFAIKEIELADELASSPIVPYPDTSIIHYTPHYLYAPTVPFDVKDFYPNWKDLKFIIILREPVERTLSSYWFKNSHLFHAAGDQGSLEEFEIVVRKEMKDRIRYEKCMADAKSDASHPLTHSFTNWSSFIIKFLQTIVSKPVKYLLDPSNTLPTSVPKQTDRQSQHLQQLRRCFGAALHSNTLGLRHVDKSIYYDQIFRWYLNFPPENFYVTSIEEWEQDPLEQYMQLLKFINPNYYVPESSKSELQRLLTTKVTHSIEPTYTHSLSPILTHIHWQLLEKPNVYSRNSSYLEPQFKKKLNVFFCKYQLELEKLVSRSFSAWKMAC